VRGNAEHAPHDEKSIELNVSMGLAVADQFQAGDHSAKPSIGPNLSVRLAQCMLEHRFVEDIYGEACLNRLDRGGL
jgi:hypothetical protein